MRVTMDMFSGRPNPSWELTVDEADNLIDRVGESPAALAARPPAALGFRGFIVETELHDRVRRPGLPVRFEVPAGVPARPPARRAAAAKRRTAARAPAAAKAEPPIGRVEAAEYLLRTAERAVSPDLVEIARDNPAVPVEAVGDAAALRPATEPHDVRTRTHNLTMARGAPRRRATTGASFALPAAADVEGCNPLTTPMNLAFWEYAPIRLNNNCYNYAMNFASNTVAQPGRRSGRPYRAFDCADVRSAAMLDGCLDQCASTVRVVALAIWPGIDFHWYRLHPGGFWAHKLGITNVWLRDNVGRVIGNGLTPETCDRGPYSLFCGYLYAPLAVQVL